MALPAVKSLAQCVDLSKTITPFISQFYDLPSALATAFPDPSALLDVYLNTNPAVFGFAFSLAVSPIFLIVAEINRNFSQVDRAWSILPTIYNFHYTLYAHLAGVPTRRLDTLLAASTIWSMRLTFNYWRRGGYKIGSEDYRWELVQKKISPFLFFLLDVLFIAFFQNILLFAITLPTYSILVTSKFAGDNASTTVDLIFSRVMAGLVLAEFFADQQQWSYQNAKKRWQTTGEVTPGFAEEDLKRGFVVSGLWSWSRHPNFACEQAFWITLYQWSCFTTDTYYNYTGIGVAMYIILFNFSTMLTESITAGKYPDYSEYQERVGRFLPRLGTLTKAEKEKKSE